MKLSARLAVRAPPVAAAPPPAPGAPSPLSLRLVALGHAIPAPGASEIGKRAAKAWGPRKGPDFFRIKALPARVPESADLTELFAKPGGAMRLFPVQSLALSEAAQAGGLLGLIGVGHGKTLISLLLAVAMEKERPLLLVPAQVRAQLITRDLPYLSRHWQIPRSLRVMSYEDLSTAKNTAALERLDPDLIIADEAHKLRHRAAARSRRFLRFMDAHPACAFVALSGTLAARSLLDYGHLAALALRDGSPLPLDKHELAAWAAALDVNQRGPGVGPGCITALGPHAEPRENYRDRLLATPGVVSTPEGSIGSSLLLEPWRPEVPPEVRAAELELEATWCSPSGDELEDPLALTRVARQLSQGFFYRWIWPGGIVDREWLAARAAWHKAVRAYLLHGEPPAGMDSPLLLANAAKRVIAGRPGAYAPPGIAEAWAGWDLVRHRPEPPVEPVWISTFLPEAAAEWARGAPGIVWYEHDAIGRALRDTGLPTFGAGPEDAAALLAEVSHTPTRSIACSSLAHGTGKNLQPWCRNLIMCPPSGGAVWEQLLGRTHRQGQTADEVTAHVARHSVKLIEAFDKAREDARFQLATHGLNQKLLYAGIQW